jgi:hypothetical protein
MIDTEKKLQDAKNEVLRLENEIKKYNKLTPTVKLATYLHSKLCNWNHIDGCGWFYAKEDDWNESAKKHYYDMAEILLADDDIDVITRIINKIKP